MTKSLPIRLWCKNGGDSREAISETENALIALGRELGTVLPGYTHLQRGSRYFLVTAWPMWKC